MKKLIITSILAALVALGTTAMAQDYPDEYLGLPGDNLNLYAVMKLFQESETIEGFERNLNDENSRINNLDLNGDNLVDYLTVSDYADGDVHNIVLRAVLNRNEYQDVAVFTVQRFRDGSVQIQLIGDEALYGRDYIIEPIYDETPNPGYMGRPSSRANVTVIRTTPFEISFWPLVRYIYLPNYVVWRSTWYWDYYPVYWHPWRPFYWHYYYGYHYNWYHHYYRHYRHWQHHRYERYNDFYYSGIRSHSQMVAVNIKEGHYKSSYSHPEQRRDGETLFTKMHPGQNLRTQDDNVIGSQGRRSVSQTTRESTTAGTVSGTSRRPETTVNDRPVTKSSSDQSTGDSRRSTTTVTNRPVIKSSSGQNTGDSRRATTTVTNRPATKSSSDQNAGVTRRSTSSVSSRSSTRPESGQRAEASRSSRSSSTSVSSSRNRSTNENKGGTTVRKSSNSKESETEKSSRRK